MNLDKNVNRKVSNVQFIQLETVCRETVQNRRQYSDDGDVEVRWTDQHGCVQRAILEVKQRKSKSVRFDSLQNYPYPSVLIDEKRLFDKIRARGDTIGYLITNEDKSVFLFVPHDKAEKSYTTRTAPDRFKGRVRTFVNVPTDQFVEGVKECAAAIVTTLGKFQPVTQEQIKAVTIKMTKEKIHAMRAELHQIQHKSEKLRREISKEEWNLFNTCAHKETQNKMCTSCELILSHYQETE